MRLTLTTIALVLAIAGSTWLLLSLAGIDVLGNDCSYSQAVGTVCY